MRFFFPLALSCREEHHTTFIATHTAVPAAIVAKRLLSEHLEPVFCNGSSKFDVVTIHSDSTVFVKSLTKAISDPAGTRKKYCPRHSFPNFQLWTSFLSLNPRHITIFQQKISRALDCKVKILKITTNSICDPSW